MIKHALIALGAAMVVASGCARSNAPTPYYGPEAAETLSIQCPFGSANQFIADVRTTVVDEIARGARGSINVNANGGYPYQRPQPVAAGVNLYTSALDDATRKAKAVATHMGATLGAPESVTEQLVGGGGSGPPVQALKGNAPVSAVRVSADQPCPPIYSGRNGPRRWPTARCGGP